MGKHENGATGRRAKTSEAENQKETEQKEAEKLASEYIVSYAETLQEDVRDVGLLDLKVTYDACSRDYFDEYWTIGDYGQNVYCTYYTLDYYSDSIDRTVFMNVKQGMVIFNHLSNY